MKKGTAVEVLEPTGDELVAGLRVLVRAIARQEVALALADARDSDEYLSTAGAAALAGVAPGTIRRWIKEGRLTGHRAGRVLRVRRCELMALLESDQRPISEASPEELARRHFGCDGGANG